MESLLNKDPACTWNTFYFLYRYQILSRHPIYYFVNLLIRVDTNRAEMYLASYSNGFFSFFSHTLAPSQIFFKVKGKRGEKLWELNSLFSISKMNMIFFHQKQKKKKKQPRTAHNYKQSSKGYSWERIIKLWKALGCRK